MSKPFVLNQPTPDVQNGGFTKPSPLIADATRVTPAWYPGIGQGTAQIAQQRNPYPPIAKPPFPGKV